MSVSGAPALVLEGHGLCKTFRPHAGEPVKALDEVSVGVPAGKLTALVGPDGAGKTTLIRLAVGLMVAERGTLSVLGSDVAADPTRVQERVGYMPQRFGLYEDLSVQENLDLYADMHGVLAAQRRERYPRLLEMTDLGRFTGRLAGRLSGGMKQKLGLACTLVRSPDMLLLDEPTVGVDPLSRRELWEIIGQLVRDEGLSALISTSYMDEAERCDHCIVLQQGKVLAQGPSAGVSALATGRTFLVTPPAGRAARGYQSRLLDDPRILDAVPEAGLVRVVLNEATADDQPGPATMDGEAVQPVHARFEDGFMVLLHRNPGKQAGRVEMTVEHHAESRDGEVVVEVRDLVRRFGAFTAVDHVSFEVRSGEIFGLLGPNGAGKTTTFRMLCGLLPASSGKLRVAGVDLHSARASARQRIGYVAQKFSLYGQLSVVENLNFFASAYGLHGQRRRARLDWALRHFELGEFSRMASGTLPGGYKQRLAMAAALLHEPEILFLDEPTSGADPLARREFWRRINAMADQGVTVIVTTHFLVEAEYCDRIAILDSGRVLAQGTPAQVRDRVPAAPGAMPTIEDAFLAIIAEARRVENAQARSAGGAA